jgi:hypothetical protein
LVPGRSAVQIDEKGYEVGSVVKEVVVEAKAEDCWDAVRDFGGLSERLAPGFVTDLVLVGPRERRITFFMGAVATEFLVGRDENAMRLAYTVTDSPLGSTHHNASVQIVPDGDGRCRFIWISDVLPDELSERTEELMEAGIKVIKHTLEAGAGAGR